MEVAAFAVASPQDSKRSTHEADVRNERIAGGSSLLAPWFDTLAQCGFHAGCGLERDRCFLR